MRRLLASLGLVFFTLHCAPSTDDSAAASDDALAVTPGATDAAFGVGGKLVVPSPLYPAADGTFASAAVTGDMLTFARWTKDGAPLSSFSSATARVPTSGLGGSIYSPPKVSVCEVGVATDGTVYVTGFASTTSPQYTWDFALLAASDGAKVRGWVEPGGSPTCQKALPTGDGRLFVQFGEGQVDLGFSAVVPLAVTSAGITAFRSDSAVTDIKSYIRVTGPAFGIGNATAVHLRDSGGALKGFEIEHFLPHLQSVRFVKNPFRKMHVDPSGILLLTNDGAVATYNLAGDALGSFALGPPPPGTAWTDAVRDASGRTWVVADHVRSASSASMGRTITRRLGNGAPDTPFGSVELSGASTDLATAVIVQGQKLVVGSTTANGYEYVRLK